MKQTFFSLWPSRQTKLGQSGKYIFILKPRSLEVSPNLVLLLCIMKYVVILRKLWPNTKVNFPRQYFNSRDLNFNFPTAARATSLAMGKHRYWISKINFTLICSPLRWVHSWITGRLQFRIDPSPEQSTKVHFGKHLVCRW